ncbi:phosphatidylglycerophosphatase [Aspergillus lucknowensis]|uniref:Mitochondrial PGP phosphatase n=1 Tax=Aspergillus lucknowensis TaxID=176173 RepID=A0ABR4M248_9EURO
MNPPNTNLRAFNLAVQTLLSTPSQFLPHLTIPTFTHLPENIGAALQTIYPPPSSQSSPSSTTSTSTGASTEKEEKNGITIRALILDKDNTLCPAKTTSFPPNIYSKLHSLRNSPTSPFNIKAAPDSVLIVSNRAGSHSRYEDEALEIEERLAGLQIPVFRLPESNKHGARVEKKPFCGKEVLDWFRDRGVVQRADEIAVVGDRLGTDVLMAMEMGAWSVWCRDGVGEELTKGRRNVLEKMELWVERYLRESRGLKPLPPRAYQSPSP